jgi:hypothetical protein
MPQPREIVKIGNRYGKLVVVDKMPHQPNKPPYWRCKCDCGNETIVVGHSLRNGLTTSCGCYKREKTSKIAKKDETGKRYGKLVVLDEMPVRLKNHVCWRCKCDCGNEKIVRGDLLRQGVTKSCGCQGRYNNAEKKIKVGNRYGKWVVISEMPDKPKYWRCKCDCGKEKIVSGQSLRLGHTTSCGCYRREHASNANKKNEIGKRYGKLLVVGESPNRHYGYICWYCKCDCGNEKEVDSRALRRGLVKSCGCLRRGRKKI